VNTLLLKRSSRLQERLDDWATLLEPPSGPQIRIFEQNPFSFIENPFEDSDIRIIPSPEAFCTAVRVSRRPGSVGFSPNPKQIGFGDEEIYVAPYLSKPLYEKTKIKPHLASDPQKPWFSQDCRPPSRFMSCGPIPSEDESGDYLHLGPGSWADLANRTSGTGKGGPVSGFAVAMTYAIARRATDIWKAYFQIPPEECFPWYCRPERQRLELVPIIKETGSTRSACISGFGYVELGVASPDDQVVSQDSIYSRSSGLLVPYWLNSDVIAHELGHQFLYGLIGFGAAGKTDGQRDWMCVGNQAFRAFHETFADFAAFISLLHFERERRKLVEVYVGAIFGTNPLTKIGKSSIGGSIRTIYNTAKFADVAHIEDGDPASAVKQYYDYSLVCSGILFDVFCVLILDQLVVLGGTTRGIAARATEKMFFAEIPDALDRRTPNAMAEFAQLLASLAFQDRYLIEEAVVIARDELATVVADFIVRSEVCPEEFSFDLLRDGLVDAAARRASASNRLPELISRCFERRAK